MATSRIQRRVFGLVVAVGLAACALIAVANFLPAGQMRKAFASGLGATTVTHTLVADFNTCTVLTATLNRAFTNTIVSELSDGEIRLASVLEDYFSGVEIDASKWITSEPNFQSDVTEGNGVVTVTNAGLRSIAAVPAPGRILEFRARMQPTSDNGFAGIGWGRQSGIGAPGSGCPGDPDCDGGTREFVKDPSLVLYAASWDGSDPGSIADTTIDGADLTQYHLFRIEWDTNQTRYYFDGSLVQSATFTSSLVYSPYLWLSSLASYTVLEVDWARVLYYPTTTGQYASCAIDTGQDSNWKTISWVQNLPAGTAASLETRSSANGSSWSAWASATSGGTIGNPNGRYLQYRIALTTTDVNASPEIDSVSIGYEQNEAPIADPGGPYVTTEGSLAVFNGSLSSDPNSDPLTYAWDLNNDGVFNDGTGVTATRTFGDGPNTRSISLRVTDESGVTNTKTTTVTINNANPVVSTPGLSSSPSNEGSPVTATATFSDAGSNDTPFTCAVNYGDGSGNLTGSVVGGTCTGPSHTYADNGNYTVAITVTDKDGAPGSKTTSQTVNNVAPAVNTPGLSISPSNEGSPVTATATFSDAGLSDTPFTCAINYGDGSGNLTGSAVGGTCTGPSHTYADNGNYTVTVTVTDKDGAPGSNTTSHAVNNVAPTVNTPGLSSSPSNEGSSVTANATFSDAGSSDTPFTCAVNYGDGSGNLTGSIVGSTCTGPAHIYTDNGNYTVTVTVTDKDSAPGSKTKSHTVNNVAPTASTTGPYTGSPNNSVAFTGNFSDPGSLDTHTFLWEFGDGITSTLQSPDHAYDSAGVFTATFTVTDKDGGIGSATAIVTIDNYRVFIPALMRNTGGAMTNSSPNETHWLAWLRRMAELAAGN